MFQSIFMFNLRVCKITFLINLCPVNFRFFYFGKCNKGFSQNPTKFSLISNFNLRDLEFFFLQMFVIIKSGYLSHSLVSFRFFFLFTSDFIISEKRPE